MPRLRNLLHIYCVGAVVLAVQCQANDTHQQVYGQISA